MHKPQPMHRLPNKPQLLWLPLKQKPTRQLPPKQKLPRKLRPRQKLPN